MIDVKLIREEPEKVKKGISAKGVNSQLVDEFIDLDNSWRELTARIDDLRAKQKELGREKNIESASEIKEEIKQANQELKDAADRRDGLLSKFPNLPSPDVPEGGEESNKVVREVGEKRDYDFRPVDYLDLATSLDLIDIETASKVSGSRFGYLKNEAVLLEFALVNLAMKTLAERRFTPIIPPVLIKPEVMAGMGKGKFIEDEDAFYVEKDNLYLVGSSEHSMGPLHMNDTIDEKDLPRRYVGFSTSFRRESGSYGKDTRGILRVHQFDKVEMMSFVHPEKSDEEHKLLLSIQEELMTKLELPYRVVEIAAGDMTFADARQFDIETWMPSQSTYRETHSCSNTTDFQSRGIRAKFRAKGGGQEFVHMLNATVFAIGRMIISIIENYQTKEGKIDVPKALRDYVGKKHIG